jgi:hypothetical protein
MCVPYPCQQCPREMIDQDALALDHRKNLRTDPSVAPIKAVDSGRAINSVSGFFGYGHRLPSTKSCQMSEGNLSLNLTLNASSTEP